MIRSYKSFDNPSTTNLKTSESILEMSGMTVQGVVPEQKKKKSQIKRNSSMLSLKSINQNIRSMLKLTKNEESFFDDETKNMEATELVKKTKPAPVTPSLKISIYNEVQNFSNLLTVF